MRNKTKLHLIENYIQIHKILALCKAGIKNANNFEVLHNFSALCSSTLSLKSRYEETFKKLNLCDASFLVLKKQLNDSLLSYEKSPEKETNFSRLNKQKNMIYRDLIDLV